MTRPVIRWYSMDEQLRTVDHGLLDLEQALKIADRYLGALRPKYESGEKALAATLLGFTREDGSYMQVSLHAHNQIDVEYDFPPIHKNLLQRVFSHRQATHSELLESRDQLRGRIELFFSESSEDMRRELANETRGS